MNDGVSIGGVMRVLLKDRRCEVSSLSLLRMRMRSQRFKGHAYYAKEIQNSALKVSW